MTAPHENRRPIVWTVAGSDSGGGAGLQADLRAFEAFGVHGCSAVAAITAQNSVAVNAIEAVSPAMLDAQLAALAQDMPPAAIKAGMLGSVENVLVMARWMDRLRAEHPALPLVVDPVLRATTGASFADAALVEAYREHILPRATLLTPNRAEAAALLGLPPLANRRDVEEAARALRKCGCRAVAITGGDDGEGAEGGAGGGSCDDYVSTPHASGWLSLPRVATAHHHGTGCTFASSAAAAMALGFVEIEAAILAKMATTQALRHGDAAGAGAGPVRAQAGFAAHIDNLPTFSIPGGESAGGFARGTDAQEAIAPMAHAQRAFAPLSDVHLGLYAVVDSAAWVRRVIDARVRTVQLRIKSPAHPRLREEVSASVAAARAAGAQLFINDHWRIAIEEGAYGVHLGQEDLAEADLEAIRQAGLRLGVSTHAYWEVCRAWALKPSYIACGPIHPTAAKAMPWIPQGNGNLAYWCGLLPVPVVAIAGMDARRAAEAAACGAAGVAVISAITAASSPESAIAALQGAIAAPRERLKAPELPRTTLR